TPFYLKALLHGLFPGPPGDEALRRELEAEADRDGREALHAKLAAVDPKTAARLHTNDVRRVVRALEVYRLTGKPISAWQQTADLIRTHTRQFAKRQLTWFRHLPACVPVPADAPDAADRVLRAWADQPTPMGPARNCASCRGEIDTGT